MRKLFENWGLRIGESIVYLMQSDVQEDQILLTPTMNESTTLETSSIPCLSLEEEAFWVYVASNVDSIFGNTTSNPNTPDIQ